MFNTGIYTDGKHYFDQKAELINFAFLNISESSKQHDNFKLNY